MASLSLYIDKWFITGSVSDGRGARPLELPDRDEDRIWLFFHEDMANGTIEYGKAFERSFRDREPHYYGDIFTLIDKGNEHFTTNGKLSLEMREIFKVSGILDHLRGNTQEPLDTYLSFSDDIPLLAKSYFIEELTKDHFHVRESVAPLSLLALERSKQQGSLASQGPYLVLVATNDNLHYALYESDGQYFCLLSKRTLPGLGLDPRRRALVELIVDNVNNSNRFLISPEEIEAEYMRQYDLHADEWMEKVERNNGNNTPIPFSGISFAVAPQNPQVVQVSHKKLEDRTHQTGEAIVRKIADFVQEAGVESNQLQEILCVGDAFTNEDFSRSLLQRFSGVIRDKTCTAEEIPRVVEVYPTMDPAQFAGEAEKLKSEARAQELRNKQDREEKERRHRDEELKRQLEAERKSRREYDIAMENAERLERAHNYEEMLEWAKNALIHKPGDDYAQEKVNLAQQLIADQKAAHKQYNQTLERAKSALDEGRWSDAISQSEMALEIQPDSEKALRIKTEALRQMEIEKKVRTFLDRVDVFFAQKLYSEALEEVKKVLNLDPSNQEAHEIEAKITALKQQHEKVVADLAEELRQAEKKQDLETAMRVTSSLIEKDPVHLVRWTGKRERLLSAQREAEERNRRRTALKKELNQALFDEDWSRLKMIGETYLSLGPDEEVSGILSKAQERLDAEKESAAKGAALSTINSLLLDGHLHEAEEELNRFVRDYPSEQSAVKDLRKKLFTLDADLARQPESPARLRTFSISLAKGGTGKSRGEEDFFAAEHEKPRPHRRASSTKAPAKSASERKDDDFFDSTTSAGKRKGTTRPAVDINDFNF